VTVAPQLSRGHWYGAPDRHILAMRFFLFRRKPPESSDTPSEVPIETLISTVPGCVPPLARRERSQKETGNPAERQTEQQRIAREDHYIATAFQWQALS
jgi:hypothetical protein